MKGLLAMLFVFIVHFTVSSKINKTKQKKKQQTTNKKKTESLASIDQIALSDFYNTLTPASQSILSWDLGNLCSEPEIICISNRVTSLVMLVYFSFFFFFFFFFLFLFLLFFFFVLSFFFILLF